MATSFEKKLDKDFWSYLTIAKDLYHGFDPDEESKNLSEAWLCRLAGKSFLSVDDKRDRNVYLSRLLLQIQAGKLSGVFREVPPDGPLKPAFLVFGLPGELDELKEIDEKGFRVDPYNAGISDDLFEAGRDGRTYLATRRIPNGLMAYLAVTVNDDEPLWINQTESGEPSTLRKSEIGKSSTGRFVKRLARFERIPLSKLRNSPEEREKLLEWMDDLIQSCNKWLRGQDPKNQDLETLFEELYYDYKKEPMKSKILQMKRAVRDTLMQDIRNRITKRREEVAKRELILDQYEADEYKEERLSPRRLDEIWLESAKRPMKNSVERVLRNVYPREVVERFLELLVQERIDIIEKREKDAEVEICILKNDSLDRVNEQLSKLQRVQNEYKELYRLYKKVESFVTESQKRDRTRGVKYDDPPLGKEEIEETKKKIREETQEKMEAYENLRAVQKSLKLQLKEAKEGCEATKESIKRQDISYRSEEKRTIREKEKIEKALREEKKKLADLQMLANIRGENCRDI